MSVHTFGDSHSRFGWNDKVNKHHIGPVLCYSFGRERLHRCNIKNYDVKDGDFVIFCFGEIDCRCHIHKYVTSTNTYQNIIDYLIFNYMEAVKENVKDMNIKVGVYSVVPTIQKGTVYENPEYPYLGTDEDRKNYVRYFNKKLEEKCQENGYIFFNVHKYYEVDGFLNKDLSDGEVHIRDGIYIDKVLSEHFKV
jgi:hypothetical protein